MLETRKASFQLPITIKETILDIHRKRYLLPAIQREFVWEMEQMTSLFDSLMRGYPIGSFLFWNVEKENIKNFQFYEFIRDYHKRDSSHNPKANITGEEGITAILDGQQRLTTLYISLMGSYADKIPGKYWRNNDAFPKRKLYLNLLKELDEESDMKYEFAWLTEEKAAVRSENQFWFLVGHIMDIQSWKDINNYLHEHSLEQSKFSGDCLFDLYRVITEDKVINYYNETSQELDKVLKIFIRVNSGGTILSYSDLLLSIATAQWKTKDAREEITEFMDDINAIGDGFELSKDLVLKSSLVLADLSDIKFKVDNFNVANMAKIEKLWDEIKKALKIAVELVASFGYNHQTLTSDNSLIPIAYYILQKENPDSFVQSSQWSEDRKKIRRWLMVTLIKRIFSSQTDSILHALRSIIQNDHKEFPLEAITEKYRGTPKGITFTEEEIENLLSFEYGEKHTFSVLALLYPTLDFKNKFHIDHIHPKSWFSRSALKNKSIPEEKHQEFMENCNSLANLQLLEGVPNEEKSNKAFNDWLKSSYADASTRKDYLRKNYIPEDSPMDFSSFLDFCAARKQMLKDSYRTLLK